MGEIEFTQYIRPKGRQELVIISMPDELCTKAEALHGLGAEFAVEMLTTGDVYMTIEKGENILASRLCPNDAEVFTAVTELIEEAYARVDQR